MKNFTILCLLFIFLSGCSVRSQDFNPEQIIESDNVLHEFITEHDDAIIEYVKLSELGDMEFRKYSELLEGLSDSRDYVFFRVYSENSKAGFMGVFNIKENTVENIAAIKRLTLRA